jgi:hypothetical protein
VTACLAATAESRQIRCSGLTWAKAPAPGKSAFEAVGQLRPIALACYQTAKRLGHDPRRLADETQPAFGRVLTLGTGTAQT